MLFVPYTDILPQLNAQGIVEVEDESNFVRLEIYPDDSSVHPNYIHHIADPGSKVLPYAEAEIFERSVDDLPDILDLLLTKLHLPELLVIPVGVWREIINCIAFDLASDPNWSEIDAMAALHQNTRNVLAVPRSETHVLINIIRALLNHAEGPQHDLILTSDRTPLLIEIFHDGALSVTSEYCFKDQLSRFSSSH